MVEVHFVFLLPYNECMNQSESIEGIESTTIDWDRKLGTGAIGTSELGSKIGSVLSAWGAAWIY